MARASRRLRVIPATFRSSATTVSYRVARSVVRLCSAPARALSPRAWMRASRAPDPRRPGAGGGAPRGCDPPGGEPERVLAPAALPDAGEPHPAALPPAFPGRGEVPQCPVQVPDRLLIRALGILRPPRQRRVSLLLRI